MPKLLTADDIIPLVAALSASERDKLLDWISSPRRADSAAYRAVPPALDEFSGDDEPLAWESNAWDEFN